MDKNAHQFVIRQATKDDLADIFILVKQLAIYERAPEAVTSSLGEYADCFEKG